MAFLKKRPEFSEGRFFRPLTLLIIWGFLALLLIANGAYEAQRAQNSLYRMLFDEGSALIDGLEKSAQGTLTSMAAAESLPDASAIMVVSPINFLALEESVVDLILEVAFRIDQEWGKRRPQESELKRKGEDEHLSGIEMIVNGKKFIPPRHPKSPPARDRDHFYQPLLEGKTSYAIRRSEKKETGQMDYLAVAVARKAGEGILVLRADDAQIRFFRRRVILQELIEEWRGKGETRYLTIQGGDLEVWADTDAAKVGKREENAFVRELWAAGGEGQAARAQKTPEVFEVAKIVALDKENRGVIRVGLSTARVEQIIGADRRNILLFSLLLLVSGGVGITFIYRMENRHLVRVREMEEKIHQSEKLSSLANLAAGVAHEIRNPLNAIGMAIQRLQREFSPERLEDREEYHRFTDVLRNEVGRVNEIIEQFLLFARPVRLDLQPVPIKNLLQDLLLLFREAAEQQKVLLEEEIESNLPVLQVDRQRIQEALWNLINNGLQAMPEGGRLRLTVNFRGGREVFIQIADTGEGIPPENLGKIFDYYFTTKEKGMGLGLPLAHKIIREHGGTIQVESVVGQGTIFHVFLPVPGEKE